MWQKGTTTSPHVNRHGADEPEIQACATKSPLAAAKLARDVRDLLRSHPAWQYARRSMGKTRRHPPMPATLNAVQPLVDALRT